ncbi:MAG: glycosyltransferase [candidate division KSB1 bacterium]|nr:glycosyltransferase [candidate division KSB1 bacterium]MDZ7274424.1 glycosyltransferase [candidate division KSB1 bacterium]MDZ7284914.1 glycosyltransferase [candidate division KSB1 bacterium]MDZ7297665.1 glycosyltransferase [candidate division KSB1 bacterium]MDZ7305911.1 glycosyltransferase [candidate division KSB1 bacterium]
MLLSACFIIYLALVGWLMRGIWRYRVSVKDCSLPEWPPVTIIVAARNEAAQLADLNSCLQRQSYPNDRLQIIIVDDRSEDDTPDILAELQKHNRFEALRLENVPERYSPKKYALNHGLAAAQHDIILLTDADCRPGPEWVKLVVSCFQPGTVAVVGFSPVMSCHATLNGLLLLDSLAVAAASLAGVGWRKPFLATGRNLAYRKSAFMAAGGFAGFARQVSGDDDVLIQRLARVGRVEYALPPPSHVWSVGGPASLRAWLRQKRRHLSAARSYVPAVQLGYLVFHACNVALWLAPLLVGWRGLLLLVLKCVADFWVLRGAAVRLTWRPPWVFFWGWEIVHLLLHLLAGAATFVGKPRWKN